MGDRTEGRDLQTMEKLSLGRWDTAVTPKGSAALTVRCPSCDHANPAGSHYCNQCGMPVHFETCGRCEAINLRGAASCHKCGCVLPASAIPESTATASVTAETPPPLARDRPDSTADSPPRATVEPAARRRPAGIRAALMALGLVLVAVPTYIATEHPASLDRVIDAIAPRGKVDADSPVPISGLPQPPPLSEPVNTPPVSPATTYEAAAAAPQAASQPPSEIARDFKASSAAASTAATAVKSAPSSTTKSGASRSKQGTSKRKPPTRRPTTKAS
jgi:Double zinc ribbon